MRLRYAADIRTLFFVALYFGTLAFLWVATPEHWANVDWRWWAPAFVVLLVTSFQGAVSTHNAVHCPIFKSRPMNKLWDLVKVLPTFARLHRRIASSRSRPASERLRPATRSKSWFFKG